MKRPELCPLHAHTQAHIHPDCAQTPDRSFACFGLGLRLGAAAVLVLLALAADALWAAEVVAAQPPSVADSADALGHQFAPWAQWTIGGLSVAGAAIALLGSLGLLRLPSYFERVHAPSIIATMGCWLIMWAAVLFFSLSNQELALYLLLIAIFVAVTVPITTIFLMRAALFRSRCEGENIPPSISLPDQKSPPSMNQAE